MSSSYGSGTIFFTKIEESKFLVRKKIEPVEEKNGKTFSGFCDIWPLIVPLKPRGRNQMVRKLFFFVSTIDYVAFAIKFLE